jgi:hypothetical protein
VIHPEFEVPQQMRRQSSRRKAQLATAGELRDMIRQPRDGEPLFLEAVLTARGGLGAGARIRRGEAADALKGLGRGGGKLSRVRVMIRRDRPGRRGDRAPAVTGPGATCAINPIAVRLSLCHARLASVHGPDARSLRLILRGGQNLNRSMRSVDLRRGRSQGE